MSTKARAKNYSSILGKDLTTKGDIFSTTANLQIDGGVEGNIQCRTLRIGESAVVRGSVCAEEVIVYGKVKGVIRGRAVFFGAPGVVESDVIYESLMVEKGVVLQGKVSWCENAFDFEEKNPHKGSENTVKNLVVSSNAS